MVPEGTQIATITGGSFGNMLLYELRGNYHNLTLVSKHVLGLGAEGMPKEVKQMHCKCLESRLNQLSLEITSLMERLAVQGM